ncbi:decarboxylase UbiD [Sulfodiicoccus acidiphilus]|uniref:Decarboxylase UbiD n=1 Tax=Sulfodiicoccus acidiphilus TaxID=1670455 RepID=A0A348B1T1_9CREN|nr:UbiD family decarboxylase [Sulfodiicoccus acidiphilus]BBD72133.1 decarboxylase UbiD [Sulfodiicoccus acidiphilus]GGT94741.1 decarboxylase UbiD [Sulfodiicoccus acidiphilus]
MALSFDLRTWVDNVRERGLLREVRGADWNLEVGCLTDMNAKAKRYTLLFDEIRGYPPGYRILTGALLDASRVGLSLGFKQVGRDMELVKVLKERIEFASRHADQYSPLVKESGPLFENVRRGEDVDVLSFPVPKWFDLDGGRYIGTADAVITRDPDTDWVNVGTYRVMVHDERTLGILIEGPRHGRLHLQKWFERGKECPIAISFGHHPSLSIFAGIEVPQGVSEYNFLGAVVGERFPVVEGPITGLPLPATGEIVVEGHVVNELRREGPFGEYMGYYSGGATMSPIIRVEAVYFRDQPIMLGTTAGRPPYDYSYFRCPVRAALVWDALEKAGIPNVRGVWCHEAGYSRAFTVVSLKQSYGGHARQAGYVAAQARPGALGGRYVVVVDDDIDPSNLNEVIWAMCSRSDPATTLDIIRDTVGTHIDPMVQHEEGKDIREYTSSRAIVVAVRPYGRMLRGDFPPVVEPKEETKREVMRKWGDVLGA